MSHVVTIDGPAGSGKTTLGRRLAAVLGLPLVDTGLFYRGVAVAAARAGVSPSDRAGLIACARRTCVEIDTDPTHAGAGYEARVDGVDAGPALRDPRHAVLLARMSSIEEVRAALLEAQRALARQGGVAVGRDCGTVVFPEARLKLFLGASESVRARRRARQLTGSGVHVDSAGLHDDVGARDQTDISRTAAPLRPAAGAHLIDTEALGIEEMVDEAVRLCAGAGLVRG